LLNTEQEEMKQHLQEQIERLRQQLEDNLTELQVKDKELKKLRLSQLILDTQMTNPEAAVGINLSYR
jgi:tRNA C32,U32 (ribose-2'-O)-methylase TrmJ